MNYWVIFITGLTTGGLSCLALQGGLLASAIAESKEQGSTQKLRATLLFVGAKLLAYSLLGLLLGSIGQVISLTPRMSGYLNLIISLFMLGVAFEILKVHPIFRYFLIQPPKFVRKKIRSLSKNGGDFAAISLGVITVLIPCAVTQAMMALAVGSASLLTGFMIMFVFILGTIPLFILLGYFVGAIGEFYNKLLMKLIAILLIFLSIYNFSNGLRLIGLHFNTSRKPQKIEKTVVEVKNPGAQTQTVQKVTIKVNDSYGYNPNNVELKVGIPVELTLQNDNARGCVRAFTIPDLNINKLVPQTGTATINFTPNKTGKMSFTCAMGMYYGEFVVK